VGLAVAWATALIAVMSLVFAASAYPAGRLQAKIGARPLLILGLVALIAADLLLGFGQSLVVLFIGIGLWGLHMGLTQGVLSALVAAMAPEHCAAPPSASLASSPGLLPWARACWPGPSGT
jgi:MFS family permease